MTDHGDLDERLRQYAERWRDAAPTAPPVDGARLESHRRAGRAWWLAGLSAAAIVVAIVSGTLLAGHDPTAPPRPLHTATPTDGVVAWAALPPTHPQIPATTTSPSPDPAETEGKPECRASDLRATATGGAAAGTYYRNVRLSLVGRRPCVVAGYPDLELLDRGVPADIPLQTIQDRPYEHPVLVAEGHPALLRLRWTSDWCAPPVHNDSIRLILPGGSLEFAGLGGSQCYGTPGSGSRAPILMEPFQPVEWRDGKVRTAYAQVRPSGDIPQTSVAGATMRFTVTLTSPRDLVLDPCPDYEMVQAGTDTPHVESYALNCAAVPYKDDQGRPYLPAGTPVRFAMQTTAGVAGTYKFSWSLDTAEHLGIGTVLTVTPATPGTPSALPTADAAQRKAAVRTGVPVIRGFLDAYGRDGIIVAARRYLPADSQPDSAVGVPRLASGSVVSAEVSSWESPDHFTLEVGLDLHFDGDPLAWDEGRNLRFVTFTRTDGAFRLEFATSP